MIDTGHLLLAIMKDENNYATQVLNEKGIYYDEVKAQLELPEIENKADFPGDDDDENKGPFGSNKPGGQENQKKTGNQQI